MSEREEGQSERVAEEGQGASGDDAEEQAATPGQEGQGDDDQATGNPKNAGEG
ncbi:MAG: hypothetical protein QOI80_1137 [Solirubrobacteraceae bacterium]|nr:hypothetical protein [Solirubrobacteraceae bacterium]